MSEENKLSARLPSSIHIVIGFATLYVLSRALDRKLAEQNRMNDTHEAHAENESDTPTDSQNRMSRRAASHNRNSAAPEPYYQKFNHIPLK